MRVGLPVSVGEGGGALGAVCHIWYAEETVGFRRRVGGSAEGIGERDCLGVDDLLSFPESFFQTPSLEAVVGNDSLD